MKDNNYNIMTFTFVKQYNITINYRQITKQIVPQEQNFPC